MSTMRVAGASRAPVARLGLPMRIRLRGVGDEPREIELKGGPVVLEDARRRRASSFGVAPSSSQYTSKPARRGAGRVTAR